MPTLTIRTQADADAKIPELLQIEFLPCEVLISPMEGPIDLRLHFGFFQCDTCQSSCFAWDGRSRCCDGNAKPFISRVTVSGGDSPVHPDWVRSLRDQCAAAGVEFVFLGWGAWRDTRAEGVRSYPETVDLDGLTLFRVGRSRSGRTLDGRTHDGKGGGE